MVGIGIEAKVTDHDLAFVWNMGGDSGDELQSKKRSKLLSLFSFGDPSSQ